MLEHPLPPGMRDLLPEEAKERRDLSRAVLERFALHGYRLVTPPAFELASVLERGLGDSDNGNGNNVIRFIEPESGEVVVLRPDMTPQIARIVATRLQDRPPPFRLAYEGTVIRRQASRAKKQKQIPQVGVELCGVAGAEGDLEILKLAADVLREGAKLDRGFIIDLSDAGIVRGLLADLAVTPEVARDISAALAKKDEASLVELRVDERILALSRLHGGRDALLHAIDLVKQTSAEAPARRLLALFDAASTAIGGLRDVLTVDPGEVRGLSYYTGTIFSIYADGPGEPIGGGGRYDDLLARYGSPQPAIGLGLDLDALAMARARINVKASSGGVGGGVVVVGRNDDPRVATLRKCGVSAIAIEDAAAAQAHASAWGYAFVWTDPASHSTDQVVAMLRR